MTYLLSTKFPNVSRVTRETFRDAIAIWLRAIAQVTFCADASAGVLVLAAVFAVSPSSAIAAAIGAGLATLLNRPSSHDEEDRWRAGLTGYNGAIVGLFWGGMFAQFSPWLALFPVALVICVLIERPIARWFAAWNLPPLALAATLVGWGSDIGFRALGLSFWHHPGAMPFGVAGIVVAVALIFVALWRARLRGAALNMLLAILFAGLSYWLTDFNFLALASLWAFTAIPIAFALYGVYLVGNDGAGIATFFATVLGITSCALCLVSLSFLPVPPLLAPFMLTVWGTLWFVARQANAQRRGIAVDQAVAAIAEAQRSNSRIVALTGAGVSTASGIPDYVSGAWLEGAPTERGYDFQSFLECPKARRAYWQSCARFFNAVAGAVPNPAHDALAAMMREGWLSTVITQNVDRLHNLAGTSHVIDLHGRIDWLRCLSCGARRRWDGAVDGGVSDIACGNCNGLVKPDVVALGENISPLTWYDAETAVRQCGVLLVIGTRLAITSAYQLVAAARRDGAKIIFVNANPLSTSTEGIDIVVEGRAEETLPLIVRKLEIVA